MRIWIELISLAVFLGLALYIYFSKLPDRSVGRKVMEIVLVVIGILTIGLTFVVENERKADGLSLFIKSIQEDVEKQNFEKDKENQKRQEPKTDEQIIQDNKPEGMEYCTTVEGKNSRLLIYQEEGFLTYVIVPAKESTNLEPKPKVGDSIIKEASNCAITLVPKKGSNEYFLIVDSSERKNVTDDIETEFKQVRTKKGDYLYVGSFEAVEEYTVRINKKDYKFEL